jgi:hypothetical protein
MSFGTKVGNLIGATGALAVHAAVRGAELTGEFGTDVLTGVGEGYEKKAAHLALPPEVRKAMRAEARAKIAVAVTAKANA